MGAAAQAIIESTVDAVIILDADGRVEAFNASAERMFGRFREDVMGREFGPLMVPEQHREAHRRGLRRAVATGRSQIIGRPVELTALRADGTEFPAEVTLSRLTGEGPPLFIGHVRDISERLAGVAAARRLAALVDSSADAIVLIGARRAAWRPGTGAPSASTATAARRPSGRALDELIMPRRSARGARRRGLERLQAAGSITTQVVHVRRDGTRVPGRGDGVG